MAVVEETQTPGIADPTLQRDCLRTLDAAFLELVAIRTKLMNQVQDDFTGLRSSAQLFREIFFGVELPVDSWGTLIERAGGRFRIIQVSYKETGAKLFALIDVIEVLKSITEKFQKKNKVSIFPIKSYQKLAKLLEQIREDDADAGATWFLDKISTRNLPAALENEARMLTSGKQRFSPLVHVQPPVVSCGCCGEAQSPASLIATTFANLSCNVGSTRWTGHPRPQPQQPEPPKKAKPIKAGRRSHGTAR